MPTFATNKRASMLKQEQQIKLLQKLSPKQIQLIRLLEVPIMQLNQRIKSEIEENPALEEGRDSTNDSDDDFPEDTSEQEEISIDDYLENDDYVPSYKTRTNNYSLDDEPRETPITLGQSFHESLMSQLGLQILNEHQQKLAEYIIGNIDEDGYLCRDLENIADDLAFSQNITATKEELQQILDIIQQFDPAGVGARTLQECLVLQLKRRDQQQQTVRNATLMMENYFNEFSRKHFDKIVARMGITEEDLRAAMTEILKLNPKPGGGYTTPQDRTAQPIVPDFILNNDDGNLSITLNERNAPDLRVSKAYTNMLETLARKKDKRTSQDRVALTFVKQKIEAAQWFIDAIKQRQDTLLRTMNAILKHQYEYFATGDEKMLQPMILEDIAKATSLNPSTISRVASSKYIQTEFGIFALKSFFSESILTTDGKRVSARRVKSILEDAIGNEDKQNPLTDGELTEVLQKEEILIARRTVAKYREQLGIPVARMRKEI